jgi:Arc/MetJ family transcription regulator
MRTNVVLDDDLVDKAFKFAPVKTKKDLVNLALKEYVETHSRLNLLEIKEKVAISDRYDYKNSRNRRVDNGPC